MHQWPITPKLVFSSKIVDLTKEFGLFSTKMNPDFISVQFGTVFSNPKFGSSDPNRTV